ncbi:MAG: outer membrane protein assembly factor BamE [Myxococcales bacterium]|nr:outer membrane protein assembly factor BamE [Myxococcales bacterium]MDH5567529.1 outer membrane protein assembly factor BamE [Myxococcales bacterium]
MRGERAGRLGTAALLVALALVLGAGCMSVGVEFPVEPVRDIEIGVTSRADVQRMFGDPWRTGIEDGQRTWTYGRYRYSLFGAAATRDLVLRFNERGVVTSYTFNSTHPSDAAL